MNDPDNRFCVYLHTRPDTMQVFYAGIGIKRKRPHSKHQRNNHWNNIVAKNDGKFIIDILCDSQSRKSVIQMEKAIIKFYGRVNNGTGILCNQTDGGEGTCNLAVKSRGFTGGKHSEEVVAQMRERGRNHRHTEEHKKRVSEWMRGRKISEETREKQRIVARGRVISEATREKCRIRMLAQVQSEATKLKRSKTMKGRTIAREAVKNSAISRIVNRGWTVEQVCIKTGAVLNNFLRMSDAVEATGISLTCIMSCINHYRGQTTAGGYYWRLNHDKELLQRLLLGYNLPSKIEAA